MSLQSKYNNPKLIFSLSRVKHSILYSGLGSIFIGLIYGVCIAQANLLGASLFFRIILFGVFLAGIVYLFYKSIEKDKLNDIFVSNFLIISITILAIYSRIVGWLIIIFNEFHLNIFPILYDLDNIFTLTNELFETDQPDLSFLYVIWAVEVFTIYFTLDIARLKILHERLICEKCLNWITDKRSIELLAFADNIQSFRASILGGDYSVIMNSHKAIPDSRKYTEVTISNCTQCYELYLLSINNVRIKVVKDGSKILDIPERTNIVDNLKITNADYLEILSIGEVSN